VTTQKLYESGKRPLFAKDKEAPNSPDPSDYKRSGYDRGHMVPNHAIESRYGTLDQKKTFLMSNIAPQTPALNQGVWRNVEHRIADFWPARYGELRGIVGTIPNGLGETLSGTDIEIPGRFYQLVVAQEGMDVRALAVVFDQHVPWHEWAARHIVSIDELEEMAGLDFLPDLPKFIQIPLEEERPSRLWPIRARDVFRLILLNLE
jgi:endonuclease G